ncbi:NAD dependent epimerase/dehydratase family protein [Fomitopsis serialis]|uniref:NAD dependent epimerase/dehydratase family protein n=1 Tax=Fomitopsis serialis TaxID=139415 RepID=UPI002008D30B|nr:NAD dependent epimerase/dehydratase family protein [Neoantrodia serialis]KAH9912287.1 NAD dependent epimerase/dehydratase family protein [Neoantrodia serialis]
MPTAIVTGATGILGREIVYELGRHPQEWTTVHALSRSKKDVYPSNIVHNFIDLTADVQEVAKELKDVSADYIFFAAYLLKGSEEDNTKVNGDMLENLFKALEINNAVSHIKRIVLVTGCKQYGVHLGRPKNPMVESDPWLPEPPYPPNFYYRQQRSLHAFSAKHGIEWVVTYPNEVIGFAKGNFMNLAASIGLYAAVHRELGTGELPFPGGATFYEKFDSLTYSRLHAEFCVWAATAPGAKNQAFNVVNGDVESWSNMWPKLAARYGMTVPGDQFSRPAPDASDVPMADNPPISFLAKALGLQGKTAQSHIEQTIDLAKWSQKPEVQAAWERLAEREGLEKDAFEKATWMFSGFVLGRNFDVIVSMSKARAAGWTGYHDTWESFEKVFDQLESEKILPKAIGRFVGWSMQQ